MIIEHVHLHIKADQSAAFEQAMHQAKSLIAVMSGFQSLSVIKHLDQADRYILIIHWDRIEDHQQGFRQSTEYLQWKALLHHFYTPMPTVEYYVPCIHLTGSSA
ncbi:heme-degrading monooxygenase HmoA [Acinetobacter calcoaceticus]|uniref:Heme-degrading monooxygenase HmoA n=1 Tax=Acinetobacter calcoaceticus TaxID=471 RepID=A0A4R1YA67_ACICA|nr:heme-degrading monooxygenase HmoA [Acinetobacter calcoaceticus]